MSFLPSVSPGSSERIGDVYFLLYSEAGGLSKSPVSSRDWETGQGDGGQGVTVPLPGLVPGGNQQCVLCDFWVVHTNSLLDTVCSTYSG